jgi:hypothetical protein
MQLHLLREKDPSDSFSLCIFDHLGPWKHVLDNLSSKEDRSSSKEDPSAAFPKAIKTRSLDGRKGFLECVRRGGPSDQTDQTLPIVERCFEKN